MQKTRLWILLRTFNEEEQRAFRDFVASPYFNRRPETQRLLEALFPIKKEAPEKEAVFPKVFPGQPYHDPRLRQSMSFLYKLALEFLSIQALRHNQSESDRLCVADLRRRRLPDEGLRILEKTQSAQATQPLRNADYHDVQYKLVLESYRMVFEQQAPEHALGQLLSDQLDTAFLARKLWQTCFLWSHQTMYNTAYDFGLMPDIMRYLETKGLPDAPGVSIYYHCFRSLSAPENPDHFRQFIKTLMAHGDCFPDSELRDLYVLAVNFCIRQNNAGNTTYRQEQFDLYREGMVKGYFTSDGYLPHHTYLNAVTTALVVQAYGWAEQFTNEYRSMLPADYRKNLWHFNHARLAYARRQGGKALELLRDVDFRDVMLQLATRTLQLKIFYELGAFDLLESHLQAFQVFIRRKKDLSYHRNNYLNLIRLVRRRLEIPPLDRTAHQLWQAQVKQTAELAEREWLLQG
ncbi:MAG: hypothetical protein ACOYNO_02645 [Saprospiraceae bacterium]